MKQIILIDAYAQIYRSFFALRGLSNQQGEPVNALYGMARFLLGLDEHLGSDYGAAVFDKGKCKRRIRILPQYKAQRPPMPDALRAQVEPIRVWMQAFGWPLLEQEGLEADDIIGCIASQSEELPLGILSYDKDLAQLVNARVSLLQPGKNNSWLRQGVQEVQEKFGVRPEQIVDYLALLGDASDNIPGVPGVGPKTAAKLLGQFGSIEKLLANLGEAGARACKKTWSRASSCCSAIASWSDSSWTACPIGRGRRASEGARRTGRKSGSWRSSRALNRCCRA